ncbi:MAG: HEAT repeat domain-containing protein [Deltaproteobacteria bacterium]|nr:HEAT repeat domain-containing protein [Deltaproteobacteria bacterium]
MKQIDIEQAIADLKDNSPEIKRMAAKAILKGSSTPEDIFTPVLKEADRATVKIIYDVLFDAGRDFSSIFMDATKDTDPRIRRQAIRYLFRKGKFKIDDGIKWLDDSDPYVRRRVLSYLAWTNEPSALERVARISITDSNPVIRKEAIKLLGIWGSKENAGPIIKALEDNNTKVRIQAVKTLEKMTGETFGDPVGASEDELEWITAKWQGWWEIVREGS